MTYNVYNNGDWKDITNFYVRNNDSWQEADIVYQKRSGSWQVIYDKGPYNWTGAGVAGFGFATFSENAIASVSFYNTGKFESFSGTYPGTLESFTYAPASKVSSLSIQFNPFIPPPSIIFSGSPVDRWVPLSTSPYWELSLPAGIVNYATVSGNVLLARGTPPGPYVVVASGILSLEASVLSIG
jgi:hypothetical protein